MRNEDFIFKVIEIIDELNDSLLYILDNKIIFNTYDKEILDEIIKLLDKTAEIVNEIKN